VSRTVSFQQKIMLTLLDCAQYLVCIRSTKSRSLIYVFGFVLNIGLY